MSQKKNNKEKKNKIRTHTLAKKKFTALPLNNCIYKKYIQILRVLLVFKNIRKRKQRGKMLGKKLKSINYFIILLKP